ncbi:hypothetical protein Bca52824_087894 [Brassica carinata]|uniref:Uncharacterized protein n=1 Tax=Brassica carinata TaxID=52824 RepID=A0A8X7TP36_BRACI|nr:hypothetical protein Bca52824_087894 [Brassica carinata]
MNTLLRNLKGQIPSIYIYIYISHAQHHRSCEGERTSCRREDASSSVKKKLYVEKVWVRNFKKFKSSILPMSMDPYGGEFQGFGKPCTKSKFLLIKERDWLAQSKHLIRESRKTMMETEDLGVSALQDLIRHRQTFLHSHSKVCLMVWMRTSFQGYLFPPLSFLSKTVVELAYCGEKTSTIADADTIVNGSTTSEA